MAFEALMSLGPMEYFRLLEEDNAHVSTKDGFLLWELWINMLFLGSIPPAESRDDGAAMHDRRDRGTLC
jgi:hypothetical protein